MKDKDNAPDDEDAWTTPEQWERFNLIYSTFNSYAERSSSGKGVHIWLFGSVGRGRKRDGVEIYSENRFMVCTGDVARDVPISEGGEMLARLHEEVSHGPDDEFQHEGPSEAEAEESVAWVASEAFDDQGLMGDLFRTGQWKARYGSQSSADVALVMMLAKLTPSDEVCWGAFRISMLGKRKKAERPSYIKKTLAAARSYLARDAALVERGRAVAQAIFWNRVQPQQSGPVGLLSDDDLFKVPAQRWLLKGVIPAEGVGVIYGPSGTYKSFVTLDLLAHLAHGESWFGRRTRACPVAYAPFEGRGGIPNRVRAWRVAHQGASSRIAFVYYTLNLQLPEDRKRLVHNLRQAGLVNGVLCLDTLAQAFPGVEENTSEGMGGVIAAAQELQRELGGVVLIVHHTGKDAGRGMRGWSGLEAAVDFGIECRRGDGRSGEFVLAKVKDGEAGVAFAFDMRVHFLGHDEDGDPITSLSVQPSDVEPVPEPVAKGIEIAAHDQQVWGLISQQVESGLRPTGSSLEGHRAAILPGMSQGQLRNAINRLLAAGRIQREGIGRTSWLRTIQPGLER